jgi:glycosyltransferase involved in cell wall biosynthesis/GT2 family glycosyltransferase
MNAKAGPGEAPPGHSPVRLIELELSQPLPAIEAGESSLGIPYGAAQCLVRLHGTPLGFMVAELPAESLEASQVAEAVWRQLGDAIAAHLRADDLPVPEHLEAAGLPDADSPPCLRRREEFLGDPPFLSVVVPTKNRPEGVAATVRGIVAGNYPRQRYEVIVVDNASGDDATVAREDFDVPGNVSLTVVREPIPGGSNARNRGIVESQGEIVVCADDDVNADSDWLATMAAPFAADPQVGGVAGLTVPSELETQAQLWFEGFGGFMRGFERRVYDIADPPADRPLFPFTVGDFGSGQNMAFRREALEEVGGFDPVLGTATVTLAGEDLELMLRILLAGRRVVYEPKAIVRHEHQRTYEQFRRRVWGYGVGLTACLTKAVLEHPRLLPLLARRLPGGLTYALSSGSAKNENKQDDYPAELTRLELRGMAYGPLAYLRSRRRLRRAARRGAAAPRGTALESAAPSGEGEALRVLIVSDSAPPLIGGANRSLELLSKRLVAQGHSVTVATAWQEGLPSHESTDGVEIHRIRDLTSRARWVSEDPYKHNPPPFPDPEAVRELRGLIRDTRPNLVHAYGWLAHSAAAALRPGEAPLLISARDYSNFCAVRTLIRRDEALCDGPALGKCVDCSSRHYGAPKGTVAALSVLGSRRLLRRRVTAVHSVSHYVNDQMQRHVAVPGAIWRVIPNFHEDTAGQPIDEQVMARLPGDPYILFVGAFRRIKGIEELFAAYARLSEPPPLVVVGTIATDTPKPFPPPGVTAIEDVPHATVMAMWERALFGVLATKAPEALGNVVHEAMSKGRPVIGTRPGGQEDMIEDGKSGLLVPCGDVDALSAAMAQLIADPEQREQMGRNALERSRAFTPEIVMPQLESLYSETIAHFQGQRA